MKNAKLHIMVENVSFPNDFVKTYANWFDKELYCVLTKPSYILSRIKWKSFYICLVLSSKTRLTTMYKGVMLSQYNNVGFGCNIHKSNSNGCNQDNSQHVPIMAPYSASVEERDIIFCLLVRWEIRAELRKIQ